MVLHILQSGEAASRIAKPTSVLVAVTTDDPLTYTNDPLSPLTLPQFGVENDVVMVSATKHAWIRD